MRKVSLLLGLGILMCSLCACGKDKTPDTAAAAEETVEQEAPEAEETAADAEEEEAPAEDYTENATQILLERKTAFSDIGEFFQVELYYPNDAKLEVENDTENTVVFTCEEEDYILKIRALEDSTFVNNWEADKERDSYTELEMSGCKAYYYAKTQGNSDAVDLYVQLETVGDQIDRYLSIEIRDSYAGDYASGIELYQNNETIKRILNSINYIGNIEKTTMQEGVLTLEGKDWELSLVDPSGYLATDNPNMTWDCQVKDSYIYISAKDSTDESVFFSTSIKKDSAATLEEWQESILKYSPDREIESRPVGAYETLFYALDESETEIDCTHAVVKDGVLFNWNSYASNRAMVEEYMAAMLDNMEVTSK